MLHEEGEAGNMGPSFGLGNPAQQQGWPPKGSGESTEHPHAFMTKCATTGGRKVEWPPKFEFNADYQENEGTPKENPQLQDGQVPPPVPPRPANYPQVTDISMEQQMMSSQHQTASSYSSSEVKIVQHSYQSQQQYQYQTSGQQQMQFQPSLEGESVQYQISSSGSSQFDENVLDPSLQNKQHSQHDKAEDQIATLAEEDTIQEIETNPTAPLKEQLVQSQENSYNENINEVNEGEFTGDYVTELSNQYMKNLQSQNQQHGNLYYGGVPEDHVVGDSIKDRSAEYIKNMQSQISNQKNIQFVGIPEGQFAGDTVKDRSSQYMKNLQTQNEHISDGSQQLSRLPGALAAEWPPKKETGPNLTTVYPSGFKLRNEAPIQQPSPQVFPSQPAFKITQPMKMRGDTKWPPKSAATENMTQEEVREFMRPKKQNKDYTEFFDQNALPPTFSPYRPPPGTQHRGVPSTEETTDM